MLLEKPKHRRVVVTARDMDSGKSKSFTAYDTTPEAVVDLTRRSLLVANGDQNPSHRRPSHA